MLGSSIAKSKELQQIDHEVLRKDCKASFDLVKTHELRHLLAVNNNSVQKMQIMIIIIFGMPIIRN